MKTQNLIPLCHQNFAHSNQTLFSNFLLYLKLEAFDFPLKTPPTKNLS